MDTEHETQERRVVIPMDEQNQPQAQETLFEKHRENIYFRWGFTAVIVVVICLAAAQFIGKLSLVFDWAATLLRTLRPVFYGLGIAYLLDPIVGRVQIVLQPWLEKRGIAPEKAKSLARVLGILAAVLLVIFLIWALIAMVLPQLLESINTIIGNLPLYYNTLRDWVTKLISDNLTVANITGDLMEEVYNYLQNYLTTTLLPKAQEMVVGLTSSVMGMARTLFHLIMGLIISIYLLMGKDRFLAQAKKLCYAALSQKRAGYVLNVCTFANRAFGGFIGGKLLDSLIIGVLCFLGMTVLKMPYAMLISILVGVTNVIPFFGPYLGAIPSALLLLVVRPVYALSFIIFILILQQLDGNVIGPRILGDATGVSGIWVVISILVFGSFFGVLGMFLAVPLFAVIYKIISELTKRVLIHRGLSPETDAYRQWDYPTRPEPEVWLQPRTRGLGKLRRKKRPASPAEETPQDPS